MPCAGGPASYKQFLNMFIQSAEEPDMNNYEDDSESPILI